MKDNRCFICKYRQEYKAKTNDDLIYDARGNTTTIPLCYGHSVELFKFGQKSFLNRHSHIFSGYFGLENDLELMNFFNEGKKPRAWY